MSHGFHSFASRTWANLAAPATERRVPGTIPVALATALIGITAAVWSVSTGHALDYDDASSHLTIARRLWDSTYPGFSQLGTVWLPVPHILLMPFTLSMWAWHNGAAGAALGVLCLITSASALYRIAARLDFTRAARLCTVAAFVINPSVLYIHTTALTEPVLIAGIAASLAGITRWTTAPRHLSPGELTVFSGIPAGVAVLSRYEGWAYTLAGILLVAIVAVRRFGWHGLWKPVLGFAAVPAAAIGWWLTYNWVLFGDPFEFSRGEYSASALQATTVANGMAPTQGSLGLSFATYNWSLVLTAGPALLTTAAVALLATAMLHGLEIRNLVIGVAASTYVFSIISLYLGKTVQWNIHTLPVDQWNTRFAMSPMLAVALLAGGAVQDMTAYLAKHHSAKAHHHTIQSTHDGRHHIHANRLLFALPAVVLASALAAQTIWWAGDPWNRSAVLAEARVQVHAKDEVRSGFLWLRNHYDGGNVLIDETSTGYGSMPTLGIPLIDCITRSTSEFTDAIANPQAYAKWVMVQREAFEQGASSSTSAETDLVGSTVRDDPYFLLHYQLVYSNGTDLIFERVDN